MCTIAVKRVSSLMQCIWYLFERSQFVLQKSLKLILMRSTSSLISLVLFTGSLFFYFTGFSHYFYASKLFQESSLSSWLFCTSSVPAVYSSLEVTLLCSKHWTWPHSYWSLCSKATHHRCQMQSDWKSNMQGECKKWNHHLFRTVNKTSRGDAKSGTIIYLFRPTAQ